MIYYVEDDANIRDLALYALKQAGFEAQGFSGAAGFFEQCLAVKPDLILLDIMLPEVDGLEILRQVREDGDLFDVPVMMLTAKGTEFDKVIGLDSGADDYLAKPFGMMELVSRVNALLRRSHHPAPVAPVVVKDEFVVGEIVLDVPAHTVFVAGQAVSLTLKEFDLLRELMANEGSVLSRSQLLEKVWDITYVGETRTVDVHVQTLRQKLSKAREGIGEMIVTVRGVGYCLKASE